MKLMRSSTKVLTKREGFLGREPQLILLMSVRTLLHSQVCKSRPFKYAISHFRIHLQIMLYHQTMYLHIEIKNFIHNIIYAVIFLQIEFFLFTRHLFYFQNGNTFFVTSNCLKHIKLIFVLLLTLN